MVATPPPTDLLASEHDRGSRDPGATDLASRPDRPRTIGSVRFTTHRGELAEAVLDSSGSWSCPKLPVLDRVLNLLHAPGRDGESGVPFGQAELARVAAWFKGEVRSPRPGRPDSCA